jgi:hypothetical protein
MLGANPAIVHGEMYSAVQNDALAFLNLDYK